MRPWYRSTQNGPENWIYPKKLVTMYKGHLSKLWTYRACPKSAPWRNEIITNICHIFCCSELQCGHFTTFLCSLVLTIYGSSSLRNWLSVKPYCFHFVIFIFSIDILSVLSSDSELWFRTSIICQLLPFSRTQNQGQWHFSKPFNKISHQSWKVAKV